MKRLEILTLVLAACGSGTSATGTSIAQALDAAVGAEAKPAGRGFEARDSNGDGFLTEDEVGAEHWARLSAADADGDAQVSKAEIEAAIASGALQPPCRRGGPGPDDDPFTRDDANGDGFI